MNHGRLLSVITAGVLAVGIAGCYPHTQTWGAGTPYRPWVWGKHVSVEAENELRRSGVEVVRLGDTTRIIIPSDLIFKVNSTELRHCGLPILSYLSKLLRYCPCSNIDMTVHTDNVFNVKRRQRLSAEQANVVASHLWADGIARERIHFRGCSDYDQVSTDHTVFGSADNRRIEINIRG